MHFKTGWFLDIILYADYSKANNPNVISQRRSCYLALDLKTGGDLRYYLKKRYVFSEKDVAFYVSCLSSALHHIHGKNIIHRDVKPGQCFHFFPQQDRIKFSHLCASFLVSFSLENIILDDRGFPHLADFGVAHVQTDFSFEHGLTSTLAR